MSARQTGSLGLRVGWNIGKNGFFCLEAWNHGKLKSSFWEETGLRCYEGQRIKSKKQEFIPNQKIAARQCRKEGSCGSDSWRYSQTNSVKGKKLLSGAWWLEITVKRNSLVREVGESEWHQTGFRSGYFSYQLCIVGNSIYPLWVSAFPNTKIKQILIPASLHC